MKKTLCITMTAVLALSILSGCTPKSDTTDITAAVTSTSATATKPEPTAKDMAKPEKITSQTEDGKTVELVTEIATDKQGTTQIVTKWVDSSDNKSEAPKTTVPAKTTAGSTAKATQSAKPAQTQKATQAPQTAAQKATAAPTPPPTQKPTAKPTQKPTAKPTEKPTTTTAKPKTAWDKPYDIEAIRAECREYAESIGFTWREDLNLDNSHWAGYDYTLWYNQDKLHEALDSYKRREYNCVNVIFVPDYEYDSSEYLIYFCVIQGD